MLREAGYRQRSDSKELTLVDAENEVEFFYLRPRDIALYVGEGTLDVGITGRDLLLDSGAKAEEVLDARVRPQSRFRFAGPAGRATPTSTDLAGMRIATSYVGRGPPLPGGARHRRERDPPRRRGGDQHPARRRRRDRRRRGDRVDAATAGLETFGEVLLESEAVLVTRATARCPPASRSSAVASRACWSPAAT